MAARTLWGGERMPWMNATQTQVFFFAFARRQPVPADERP